MIEELQINRILDLKLSEDCQELREAAKGHTELASLMDEYLEEYLRLFPEPGWREIYSGGALSIRTGPKRSTGYSILSMLKLTKTIVALSRYDGVEKLLSGFKNPTQIDSAYFEVLVAGWCAERAVTRSLVFSPEVLVKGSRKYPEFLWRTELGDLYCECKRANMQESNFHVRIDKLNSLLNDIYAKYKPWDSSLRLDVKFDKGPLPQIQAQIKSVVAQAANALRDGVNHGQTFSEGVVTAVLRLRDEPPPQERETIWVLSGEVVAVAKNINEIAYLSLTMSLAKYRQEAAARLLREARRQLPEDSMGAVFIELGGAGAAQQKLQSILGEPVYENTPWVSVWAGGEMMVAVWREGQPFNDRLL